MLYRSLSIVAAMALVWGISTQAAAQAPVADPKADAISWQKKATDTRATVMGVAAELEKIGDQGNAAARGMIDDANHWVAEGDESTAQGDEKMAAADYPQAKNAYNMAWNHYVRAATSGLTAKSMLTGQ